MKPILRAAIEDTGTNRKAVADALGVPYHYLADSLNDAEPQRLPVDLLVPFLRATNLQPLRWLAQQLNCAIVELPSVLAERCPAHAYARSVLEGRG